MPTCWATAASFQTPRASPAVRRPRAMRCRVPHLLLLVAVARRLVGRHAADELAVVLEVLLGPRRREGEDPVVGGVARRGDDLAQLRGRGRHRAGRRGSGCCPAWWPRTRRVGRTPRRECLPADATGTSTMELSERRPSAARHVLHPLHDGAARSPPAVLRVHAHGDLGAVQVVAQRELHHADPDDGAPVLPCRELDEAAVPATVVGEGPDLAQVEAGPVGPGVMLDRVQHGVPRRQALVVRRVELPHLHWPTLPRARPPGRRGAAGAAVSAGRPRTPSRPPRCSRRAGPRPLRR